MDRGRGHTIFLSLFFREMNVGECEKKEKQKFNLGITEIVFEHSRGEECNNHKKYGGGYPPLQAGVEAGLTQQINNQGTEEEQEGEEGGDPPFGRNLK